MHLSPYGAGPFAEFLPKQEECPVKIRRSETSSHNLRPSSLLRSQLYTRHKAAASSPCHPAPGRGGQNVIICGVNQDPAQGYATRHSHFWSTHLLFPDSPPIIVTLISEGGLLVVVVVQGISWLATMRKSD